MSVSVHLISPESSGLFSAAIIDSDPYAQEVPFLLANDQVPTYQQLLARTDTFASILGCGANDLPCLRE